MPDEQDRCAQCDKLIETLKKAKVLLGLDGWYVSLAIWIMSKSFIYAPNYNASWWKRIRCWVFGHGKRLSYTWYNATVRQSLGQYVCGRCGMFWYLVEVDDGK